MASVAKKKSVNAMSASAEGEKIFFKIQREISALAGSSGIGTTAGQAASRTSEGMATEASPMLSDKRMAQNKKQKCITSQGMKHKSSIW